KDVFKVIRKENGLVNNSIWSIYRDKETNLWFTSDQNGISKLASERFVMFNTKEGFLADEVKRVYEDKKGNLWLGTKDGVTLVRGNEVVNLGIAELKGNNDIWAITEHEGKLLFGTPNGLCYFDKGIISRIYCKDRQSQLNAVYDIYVDNSGQIWLGTQGGVALVSNGFIEPFQEAFITKNFVNSIYQSADGTMWFSTDDGLISYDGKKARVYTESDGLKKSRVRCVIPYKQNELIIATSSGLFLYKNKKFKNISEGLSESSDEIYSVIVDKNQNIWAGVTGGLLKIRANNNFSNYKIYTAADGFIGAGFSQNAIILDKSNRLLIGCPKGLVVYNEHYDKENTLEPKTRLNAVELFFEETDWSPYSDSVTINNIPYNLVLTYDKNYLTFKYIGVSLTTPTKVKYRYMLQGFDTDWRVSSQTEASYSNIPPGKYKFIVYANNGEGVWNKKPIEFEFEILPPFWKTWWFYSIIVLIISFGVYSYIKIRAANFKILRQNEIIEEKNDALSYANQEIAEKNRNITDSINYAKRIQQSFITSETVMNKILNEHFVLFKPRDIVSGDFYQAFDLPDRTIVVCADCTGHGIPGAFMSLIGISILKEISKVETSISTSDILNNLREGILDALNPERKEDGAKDGMDVTVLSILKKRENGTVQLEFSGANNPLIHLTSNENGFAVNEYKGDKQPAGYYSHMKPFTKTEINAHKGDKVYLFTDGYADQFGGLSGKKFMSKKLKTLIKEIAHLSMKEQKEKLDEAFVTWQGRLEQVDDVTVIGIKL
ncbi:MAG: two-component regulator propeller domain-containing protein, partial [Bacteroidia bacterium]